MNPIRHIHPEPSYDLVNSTTKLKHPVGEFEQQFEVARLERDRPIRVRRIEREPGRQDQMEKANSEEQQRIQGSPQTSVQASERSDDKVKPEQREGPDVKPVEPDHIGAEIEKEEPENGEKTEHPSEGDESEADITAQAIVALVKAGAESDVALTTAVSKVQQNSGEKNKASDLNLKARDPETASKPNEVKVKPQNLMMNEQITSLNQTKGKSHEPLGGLPSEGLNPAQLSAKEDEVGKSATNHQPSQKIIEETGGKEQPTYKEVYDPKGKHLDVFNNADREQSAVLSQPEQNDRSKTETTKSQATMAQPGVGEKAEAAMTEFNQQNLGEHSQGDKKSLEQMLMNQVKTNGGEKIAAVKSTAHSSTMNQTEMTGSADQQENVDRIVKAARASINQGSARIQIRLEPPELGFLRIEIKQSGNGWHLLLQATNVKAQQLLQQHSTDLQAALESHGILPRQIDVQLRLDLNNEQNPGQQQENFDQQSFSPQSDSYEQSDGDGVGQGGLEPSPEQEEFESAAANESEASGVAWQELEFGRLDVRV